VATQVDLARQLLDAASNDELMARSLLPVELAPPTSDIPLEPPSQTGGKHLFRDRRWRVVWAQPRRSIAFDFATSTITGTPPTSISV
jgi:hypothetical protein